MAYDPPDPAEWRFEVLRAAIRFAASDDAQSTAEFTPSAGRGPGIGPDPNDPEQVAYFVQLVRHIREGRDIVATYNLALLVVLVVLSAFEWYRRVRDRRRANALDAVVLGVVDAEAEGDLLDDGDSGSQQGASSSSSSTLRGTASPPATTTKDADHDIERQPLLGSPPARKSSSSSSPSSSYITNLVSSWLVYQPGPIPILNRPLPPNSTSLLVLSYLALTAFYLLFRTPLSPSYSFALAIRAGHLFVANLPLLYLLACKNNRPLQYLTGTSYEGLNIFHRAVGEVLCALAAVHFGEMLSYHLWGAPAWFDLGALPHFLTRPMMLLGIGAFASYELLYLTSLATVRRRWYELFLACHVTLQASALVFVFLHSRASRPYVGVALAVFLVDRLVWRLGVKSTTLQATLEVLEDGETVRLSADWDVPCHPKKRNRVRQSVLHGWQPMDYVFVSVPSLGASHALQAHPFTIASAAPRINNSDDNKTTLTHAWLSLLIRAHDGFTSDLLAHAKTATTVPVRLDGPYGSPGVLDMLRASEINVLIAGGSGIAVIFPLASALAQQHRQQSQKRRQRRREVHLLWAVRSRAHHSSWVPRERLDELKEMGVRVVMPEPTGEGEGGGRPDVAGWVAEMCAENRGRRVGVVVSGPDGMNRTARNACAREVRKGGADVRVRVEKFGW